MIYVMRAGNTEFVKIGFTNNKITLEGRVCALSTGSFSDLSIEATMPGSKKKESCLHAFCVKRHVRGEWFRLTKSEVSRMIYKYHHWSPMKSGIKKVPRINHLKAGSKITYLD